MDLFVVMVAAYFALLGLGMVFRKKALTLSGPWWFLLRAFFPNWQFFHGLGPAPRLWVRSQSQPGQWSNWQAVYPRLPRRAWHLLHNPAVNLALSHQNLVEHLATDVHDLAENADIRDCVSYQLVTRLACDAVQGGSWADTPMLQSPNGFTPQAFQFEIRLLHLGQVGEAQLLLLSPVIPLRS